MAHLLPFDELNVLRTKLEGYAVDENGTRRKMDEEDIIDELLDLYLLTYGNGVEDAMESLSIPQSDSLLGTMTRPDPVREVIYRQIDGKTFEDRIREYAPIGDIESIMRVAETDSHRIYNTALFTTAESSGYEWTKTWVTMKDPRVRETHDPLEGVTLGAHEEFYTFDGDSAMYPGDFTDPNNNINCRCVLRLNLERV